MENMRGDIMGTNLRKEVASYINQCEEVIKENDENKARRLIDIVINLFTPHIEGIAYGVKSYTYRKDANSFEDLMLLKAKLEVYEAELIDEAIKPSKRTASIINNIDNKNNNTNINQQNIHINFAQVKENISNNGMLHQNQIDEILEKINVIEEVCNSNESKNSKWVKLKSCMIWLGDKGVDVAIQLLPLIIQTLK
jgi:hypothetical protein